MSTKATPYIATINDVAQAYAGIVPALEAIATAGALLLMEDLDYALENIPLGKKIEYATGARSKAYLHDARLVAPAPVEAPTYYPLHPAQAPGPDGELLTLAQLEENAGLLEASASGAEGGWVAVYLATRQGIDTGGKQFAVVCEHHGNIGPAENIAIATNLLREPALFCADCAGRPAAVEEEEELEVPYHILLTTLEPGSKSAGVRRPLYSSDSFDNAQDVFLAVVHGAEGAGVAASGYEAGDGALEAPVQLLEFIGHGRLTRRWYFAELVEPAAFLHYEGPDFVVAPAEYVAWADDALEEADIWAQVREWEQGGTHAEYSAAVRRKFGQEPDQLPWQWQGQQEPEIPRV